MHSTEPGSPLVLFLAGLVVAFLAARLSTRLIRARVRWWPRDLVVSGVHVHHAVLGVLLMAVAGAGGLAVPPESEATRTALAALFGIGTGLVLDEFALILHLEDVYWTKRGRTSVDMVCGVVVATTLLLSGVTPLTFGLGTVRPFGGHVETLVATIALAAVTLLKGKVWTCLVGCFFPPLLLVGALRLSRPKALWARWRYARRDPRRQAAAGRREESLRAPVRTAAVRLQEVVAGRHDLPEPRHRACHTERHGVRTQRERLRPTPPTCLADQRRPRRPTGAPGYSSPVSHPTRQEPGLC